jgi:hypothetical protein
MEPRRGVRKRDHQTTLPVSPHQVIFHLHRRQRLPACHQTIHQLRVPKEDQEEIGKEGGPIRAELHRRARLRTSIHPRGTVRRGPCRHPARPIVRDLATLLLRVVADVEGAVVEAVAEVARKVDSVVPIRNNTPL